MCLDNSPRCVWVTHEKECVYSHLFVCSFEDKNRCVAVTHFVLECSHFILDTCNMPELSAFGLGL